ncbi:hypothetical protein R3Q06_36505, partial [Rhodococcus erythropolis]|uniref:hypothetical protein n=1 Tax=Rhodococcus erythropolis TaxID=1833 RepID=UPI0029495F86
MGGMLFSCRTPGTVHTDEDPDDAHHRHVLGMEGSPEDQGFRLRLPELSASPQCERHSCLFGVVDSVFDG